MSDFDDNWQLTGSSDPATPDIQPHQIEAQNAAQPVFQQPVQPVQPMQPMQNVQPQMPVKQAAEPQAQAAGSQQNGAPAFQQPLAQPYAQPMYQQPVAQPYNSQPMYQQPGFQQPVYNNQPGMQGYGYPAQPANYQYIEAEREKNLNECARMINHFSPKVDLYQEYEQCKTDIARYSRQSVAPLVWGILVSLFGMIFVYSAVTSNSQDSIITNAVIAGVLVLFGAGLVVLFVLKKIHNKKKTEALYVRLGELSTELNLLYNGFSNCVLPPEFTDPRILFKIQSLIISGRCVTINNAVNSLLSLQNTYMRINMARTQFLQDTAARFDGKPAFFNAVRYMNLR